MAKNIILIGMMGCGKSTVGAILARKLGRQLVDTDSLIEAREGRSINDIFAAEGEEYFRACELAISVELGTSHDLVISCGGGLPTQQECINALKKNGVVFWLHRDPGETYDTMDISRRPLAQNGRQDFLRRFADREPIYRAAADHVICDFTSPEITANKILEVLR